MAVEEALEDLLSRDTHYREALNAHLADKIKQAQSNRLSRIEAFRKVLCFLQKSGRESI